MANGVKLAAWRKIKGWTQEQLAEQLGVSQPYVSLMERAREPNIPGPGVMIEIYSLSDGMVQPNDFYDLPKLRADAQLEAA